MLRGTFPSIINSALAGTIISENLDLTKLIFLFFKKAENKTSSIFSGSGAIDEKISAGSPPKTIETGKEDPSDNDS